MTVQSEQKVITKQLWQKFIENKGFGQAPGASGAAGQCVTPPWTLGVAGGGGAESGGQTLIWRPWTLWSVWSSPRQSQE